MTITQMAAIKNQVERMTRAELEAQHVAAGITKWGETERAGLARQAARKSLDTLRLDHMCRMAAASGVPEGDIRDAIPEGAAAAAGGALEDGPS